MLLHMILKVDLLHEALVADLALERFVLVGHVREVMDFPLAGILRRLLVAHFTHDDHFHVRVVEVLQVLQTRRVRDRCF